MDQHLPLLAASYAARAHLNQMRKDGRTPYVAHVFRVALVVRHIFGVADGDVLAAAILHDTIEDTTTDFDDLEASFGGRIAAWVALLTKDKKLPEAKREAEYLRELDQAPWQVKLCKLGDLYDNVLDSEHLPPEKKTRSAARHRHYWQAFQRWSEPELQAAKTIVEALVKQRLPS